ncbi:hypothetical protein KJS94_14340 [Flavihumibacter rivuli]|uniref:hypothetical protein n=1 Tax=Flavihumibacter rivuli TaxID=2838156 RepID=UPI001BDEE46C|nr:hypothetical protein [Flavihumibacter rivuli]ULQ55825.1 hypothetical protein KJS94_14340 [Flavihumibacter rivuli]
MTRQQDEPKILLDADVVIHFIKGGSHLKLASIFPGRLVMLDKVKQELIKHKSASISIENFLHWTKIPVIPMPKDVHILREYAALKKLRGEGESACMAVARFRRDYIASSNLKDIKSYCQENQIVYYTTMDILEFAITKGIMNQSECDQFIKEVTSKGSKLPFSSMAEFRKHKGKGV